MRRLSVVSLVFAVGALSCVAAQAQTSTKTKTHPSRVQAAAEQAQIVVTKRSFLDSGNVVPVGTTHRYMDGGTVYANSPGNTNSSAGRIASHNDNWSFTVLSTMASIPSSPRVRGHHRVKRPPTQPPPRPDFFRSK